MGAPGEMVDGNLGYSEDAGALDLWLAEHSAQISESATRRSSRSPRPFRTSCALPPAAPEKDVARTARNGKGKTAEQSRANATASVQVWDADFCT